MKCDYCKYKFEEDDDYSKIEIWDYIYFGDNEDNSSGTGEFFKIVCIECLEKILLFLKDLKDK